MAKLIILSPMLVILLSCGVSEDHPDRIMEKGETYSVSKGDVIIKNTTSTLIKVTHINGNDRSKVELIDGNATITHPSNK